MAATALSLASFATFACDKAPLALEGMDKCLRQPVEFGDLINSQVKLGQMLKQQERQKQVKQSGPALRELEMRDEMVGRIMEELKHRSPK